MKKTIFLFAVLLAVAGLSAQTTFTVANADSVDINYKITSRDNATVNLNTGTYTGHVVVPETVSYHDTTWTVDGMEVGVFQNSTVTYVHLPGTIHSLNRSAFKGCTQLDSLRFDAVEPMDMVGGFYAVFGNSFPAATLPVYVGCGHLSAWTATANWKRFALLTSDCAVHLTVIPTMDSVVRVDSVPTNNGLNYSSGYYDPGETALLTAIPFTWQEGYMTYTGRHGIFLGWSDGSLDATHPYVVPAHDDTVLCYVDTMPYATLDASRIITPVYLYGTLSYDGNQANYRMRDVSTTYTDENGMTAQGFPSTIYATGLWVGSHDHVAALRFQSGYEYLPGPLRTDGSATTTPEMAMTYSRVWHVTREMIDYHINHCGETGYTPANDILTWPGNGAPGFAEQLAPYYDADSNGRYNALAGDYPIIRGDECVFSIFNDAGQHNESQGLSLGIEVHAMTYAFNEPQDSALWNTVFVHYDIYNRSTQTYPETYFGAWTDFDLGYAWDDYIGCDVRDGIFYAYNGNEEDGNIGMPSSGNNFTGVPPAQGCAILGGPWQEADGRDNPKVDIAKILNPGYTNNQVKLLLEQYRLADGTLDTAAVNADAELFYSLDPMSWYFLPGDTLGNMALNGAGFGDGIADNERIGMTNFQYYENSSNGPMGEPYMASDYYNYMRSYWKNGQHVKYGGNGLSTNTTTLDANFMFPGYSDPWHWGTDGMIPDINPDDWNEATSDNYSGDRRGVGSCGPFTFQPTTSRPQQLDLAYTIGFGSVDVASSIAVMQTNTRNARRQWAHDTTDSNRPFVYMPYSAPHETGIDKVEQETLRVYPNPTTGLLNVSLPMAADLQLYDMMGRRLMAVHATQGTITLDLSGLSQGVYLLRALGNVQRIVIK